MGTTADKGAYLKDTKSLLKQKINNLGGDITDNTTFRQYAEQLQNVYDILPKTDYAEGSNITLSNCLKGKLDFENDIVGYGQTEQKSYEGYNQLKIDTDSFQTRTINGVTVTNKGDGSIILNGTSTGEVSLRISSVMQNLASGTYTFTLNDSGSASGIVDHIIFAYNPNEAAERIMLTHSQNTFSTTKAYQSFYYWLYFASGKTFTNYIIKPMLENGSIAHNYEPYVCRTASPNPDYPQSIEVVRGKNRFDISQVEIGKAWNNASSTARAVCYMECKPNTIYTISINNSVSQFDSEVVRVFEKTSKDVNTMLHQWELSETYAPTRTITTDSTTNVLCIQFNKDNISLSDFENVKIQIEKGSQATSYLPYNTVEIEERGKNWFTTANVGTWTKRSNALNIEYNGTNTIKLSTNSSTYGYGYSAIAEYPAKIGKKYVISYKVSNKTNSNTADGNHILLNASEPSLTGGPVGSTTVIATDNKIWLYILLAKISTETSEYATVDLSDIQIEEISENETEPTTYEPYQEPKTYQLSLGEYEFARIGNYVDTIEYDVDEDKVYKNKAINKVSLKSLIWETSLVGTNSYGTASLLSYIGKVATDINIICSHATGIIFNNRNWFTDTTIYDETNGYVVFRNTSFTSLEDFTTFLNNNNVYAYYVLATATREEITGTLKNQIKALYNSQSFTGTTIIASNGELPLVLKVRALKGN